MSSRDFSKPLFIATTTLSAITAGGALFTHYVSIPSILLSAKQPKLLSAQWREQIGRAASLAIPSSILSGLCALTLAYTHHHPQAPWRARNFIISGILSLAIVPFTFVTIVPTNKRLYEMEEGFRTDRFDDAQAPEVERLVRKWNLLGAIRGIFPLLATFAAFEGL